MHVIKCGTTITPFRTVARACVRTHNYLQCTIRDETLSSCADTHTGRASRPSRKATNPVCAKAAVRACCVRRRNKWRAKSASKIRQDLPGGSSEDVRKFWQKERALDSFATILFRVPEEPGESQPAISNTPTDSQTENKQLRCCWLLF